MCLIKDNIDEGFGMMQARIFLRDDECSVCGNLDLCFTMDGSAGEFFNGAICKQCVLDAFENRQK